jgi:hypothetical protein
MKCGNTHFRCKKITTVKILWTLSRKRSIQLRLDFVSGKHFERRSHSASRVPKVSISRPKLLFYCPGTHRSHLTLNLANLKMSIKTLGKGYFQNLKWVQSKLDNSTLNLTQTTVLSTTSSHGATEQCGMWISTEGICRLMGNLQHFVTCWNLVTRCQRCF